MIRPMQDVKGKTAFVTGGANGIGLGIARALVNAGANVVIADIREESLAEAKAYLGADERVETVVLDVTDRAAYVAAADKAEARFGKVHILVNNAGIGITGPAENAKFDDWDWGMDVNLGGVINGTVIFMPRIKAHGEGGQIVTTSSKSALVPIPGAAIYTTAKAAVMGMMDSLRAELAPANIGVSTFCPGPVGTNIAKSGELRPDKYKKESGFAEYEANLQERPNDPLWMSIEEVGERVLAGIQRNDMYILTHREFKEGAAMHYNAILESFPDEPVNEERKKAIFFLVENQVFEETVKDRKGEAS